MQKKLYFIRKFDFKMTQQEVANYLGLTLVTYQRKEKGESLFNSNEMFALSKLFKRDIEEIFIEVERTKEEV